LEQSVELNRFLAGVERRAFRIAEVALRDREDALDVVQVAMLRLAQNYVQRPSEEWQPLFYRILYNAINDCRRRRAVRNRLLGWLPGRRADDESGAEAEDPLARVADGAPDQWRWGLRFDESFRCCAASGTAKANSPGMRCW